MDDPVDCRKVGQSAKWITSAKDTYLKVLGVTDAEESLHPQTGLQSNNERGEAKHVRAKGGGQKP